MITVERAEPTDARVLAETSVLAFEDDVNYGAPPPPGGPPGYDSPAWHERAFTWGQVYRLAKDGAVVGGAILIPRGADTMELGRVWLVPDAQGRGLGRQVMTRLEELYPAVRSWRLETPPWNWRTQAFYAACGYTEVRRTEDDVFFAKERPGA